MASERYRKLELDPKEVVLCTLGGSEDRAEIRLLPVHMLSWPDDPPDAVLTLLRVSMRLRDVEATIAEEFNLGSLVDLRDEFQEMRRGSLGIVQLYSGNGSFSLGLHRVGPRYLVRGRISEPIGTWEDRSIAIIDHYKMSAYSLYGGFIIDESSFDEFLECLKNFIDYLLSVVG